MGQTNEELNMAKNPLSFKDFLSVDYTPKMPELISKRAKKRKTGEVGESSTDPCWNGYKQVGMKNKNGKKVPNCVPALEEASLRMKIAARGKTETALKKLGGDDAEMAAFMVNQGDFKELAKVMKKMPPANRAKIQKVLDANLKEEVELDEALNLAQRRKRSLQFRKLAPRIKIARKRAMKRAADMGRLKRRARKAARKVLFTKIAKADKKDLSYSRKQEVEKRLDSPAMKMKIDRMAIRMLPQTRQKDKERRARASERKET